MTVDFKVGNCLERLKELQESSVDCMVTDPPYGYSFMGKDWDKVVIGTDIWKECLRVLKPGAFAFVMSAPRQDVLSRMMINLENSGFETGFTSIYWVYATGFPKGMNISKSIDKKLGKEPTKVKKKDYTGPKFADEQFKEQGSMMQTHKTAPREEQWETKPASEEAKKMEGAYAGFQPKPAVEVIIVCMKPLSEKNYVDQAMSNGKGVTWLNDCRIPSEGNEHFRGKVNKADTGNDMVFDTSKSGFHKKGYQSTDSEGGRYPANLLVSDNVIDTGEKHGVSGTAKSNKTHRHSGKGWLGGLDKIKVNLPKDEGDFSRYFDLDKWSEGGRYPANIMVSDNVLDIGEKTKSHTTVSFDSRQNKGGSFGGGKHTKTNQINDEGDFSRYFDADRWWAKFIVTPKASKAEKNKGLDNWEEKEGGVLWGNRKDKKPSMKTGSGNERNTVMKNTHPTVKPLKLMSYLIVLGSRPNDTIIDPFSGSGTTCLAANILGRNAIGIEINPEYAKIAKARLEGWN